MKHCLTKIFVITSIYILAPAVVNAHSHDSAVSTVLVLDRVDNHQPLSIKNFRVVNIKASASGQFSAAELTELFALIPAKKNSIWIVDLRQESHGFVDGMPVTWYVNQNRLNENKSTQQIEKEEQQLLNHIAQQNEVELYTLKKLDNGAITVEDATTVTPNNVQSEQQLVTTSGANYYRLYVLDHHRPDDQAVDNFVEFVKSQVKNDDWLHFHCRGGKGRSSTFIAMYDMIKSAQTASFRQIMRQQADLGNKDLGALPTSSGKIWKLTPAKDRYAFLQKFYNYVEDPNGYAVRNWSSWLSLKNVSK